MDVIRPIRGLTTDPVGSMHVSDALELLGAENVADLLGTEGQGMGMPTVSIEQIAKWNPDAVLVSEYSMLDSESSNTYGEILQDSRWSVVPCVAAGNVYWLPQSPFAWFGRPPSAMRLLGCMLLLRVLYPDYAQDIDLAAETRAFYKLFLHIGLEDDDLDQILATTGVNNSYKRIYRVMMPREMIDNRSYGSLRAGKRRIAGIWGEKGAKGILPFAPFSGQPGNMVPGFAVNRRWRFCGARIAARCCLQCGGAFPALGDCGSFLPMS